MARRVGLVVDAEFLRLVLRQLLRRVPGIELAGEVANPSAALALQNTDALIADAAACETDPENFTALCRRFPGRIVLIGDGHTVERPGLVIPPEVHRIPMGTSTTTRDLSLLATRLEETLWPLACPQRDVVPQAMPDREPALQVSRRAGRVQRPELVVIAASTGGPEALQELLGGLRQAVCPIVIALHIPAEHCSGLARHLASFTGHEVSVGEAGLLSARGVVLLRGGMDHIVLERGDALWLRRATPARSVFHPNADVLLGSGAALDRAVVGIVLTGMGNDGCAGAAALAARGFPVLAQTPATCAVPGMPTAAIKVGAVREVASPAGIADRLNAWFALPHPQRIPA
jgi:two-component system, chemotaxis family, protein-glutamate methylesterase/glutaminase